MDLKQLDEKLAGSFKKVKEEMEKVKKEMDFLRQSIVPKEDFTKLFNELKTAKEDVLVARENFLREINAAQQKNGKSSSEAQIGIKALRDEASKAVIEIDKIKKSIGKMEEKINAWNKDCLAVCLTKEDYEIKTAEMRKKFDEMLANIRLSCNNKKEIEKQLLYLHDKINYMKEELDQVSEYVTILKKTNNACLTNEQFEKAKNNLVKDKDLKEIYREINRLSKKVIDDSSKVYDMKRIYNDLEKVKDNMLLKKDVMKMIDANSKKFASLREEIDDIEKNLKKE